MTTTVELGRAGDTTGLLEHVEPGPLASRFREVAGASEVTEEDAERWAAALLAEALLNGSRVIRWQVMAVESVADDVHALVRLSYPGITRYFRFDLRRHESGLRVYDFEDPELASSFSAFHTDLIAAYYERRGKPGFELFRARQLAVWDAYIGPATIADAAATVRRIGDYDLLPEIRKMALYLLLADASIAHRWEEVLGLASSLGGMAPPAPIALRAAGYALVYLGRPGEAIRSFESYQAAVTYDSTSMTGLAMARIRQRDYVAAMDWLCSGVAVDPYNMENYALLLLGSEPANWGEIWARLEALAPEEDELVLLAERLVQLRADDALAHYLTFVERSFVDSGVPKTFREELEELQAATPGTVPAQLRRSTSP